MNECSNIYVVCQQIEMVKVSWVAKMSVLAWGDSQVERFDVSRVGLKG